MPTKIEKDALTGQDTTGHEWDGVKELNTPLPTWWVYTFYATIVFAVVYCVLYPSWPWLNGHTNGLLGYSSRAELTQSLDDQAKSRGRVRRPHPRRLAGRHPQGSRAVQLRPGRRPRRPSRRIACSAMARAAPAATAFPISSTTTGCGAAASTRSTRTIQHGIRNADDKSRQTLMPRFGADGLLTAPQVAAVTDYVLSLSGRAKADARGRQDLAGAVRRLPQADGKGNQELGAPNLTDGIWLYGGDAMRSTGRSSTPATACMPAWSGRLDEATIKMLAIYVHSLGGGR